MTQRNDLPDPDDPVDSQRAESPLEQVDAVAAAEEAADLVAHEDLLAADLDAEKSPEKN